MEPIYASGYQRQDDSFYEVGPGSAYARRSALTNSSADGTRQAKTPNPRECDVVIRGMGRSARVWRAGAGMLRGKQSARQDAKRGSVSRCSRSSSSWTKPIAGETRTPTLGRGREKALRKVLEFAEQDTSKPRGLGLVGPVGCGKTSLWSPPTSSLAPRLLEYPAVPASAIQFVSVLDLFDLLRSSFDENRRTGEPRSRTALQTHSPRTPAGAR